MMRINLLPWREKEREEKRRQFYSLLGLTTAISFFLLIIIHSFYAEQLNIQEQKITLLKTQISKLDKDITAVSDLKKQKTQLVAKMKIIDMLQKSRPSITHIFDEIVKVLPPGVFLTSIERKKEQIILTGRAESNTNVSTLMRNISQSLFITDPVLAEIKATSDQADQNDFRLELKQKQIATMEKK